VVKIRGRASDRYIIGLGMVFILVVAVARVLFGDYENWDEAVRRVVVFRLDSISFGFLLYFVVRAFQSSSAAVVIGWAGAFVALALVAMFITLLAEDAGRVAAKVAFGFVAPIFGASAIGVFFFGVKTSNRVADVCVFLGRISYSIYLFHTLVIVLIRPHLAQYPLWTQIAVYLLCISGFSTSFYLYFERPIFSARPSYASVGQ